MRRRIKIKRPTPISIQSTVLDGFVGDGVFGVDVTPSTIFVELRAAASEAMSLGSGQTAGDIDEANAGLQKRSFKIQNGSLSDVIRSLASVLTKDLLGEIAKQNTMINIGKDEDVKMRLQDQN
jgi:hypothetical protein